MAALNLSLPVILDEQKEFLGGEISVANYAPSGTDDLAIESVKALADKKLFFYQSMAQLQLAKISMKHFIHLHFLKTLPDLSVHSFNSETDLAFSRYV